LSISVGLIERKTIVESIKDFITGHKIVTGILVVLGLFVLLVVHQMWGPYRFYRADAVKPAPGAPIKADVLKVGVAKRDVTPDLSKYDKFIDANGDNKYDPAKGDRFEDTNHNGKVDAVWIAGFGNNRPAQGVHDPLWARAIAFENNGVKVVLVTVDSIGIFHDNILKMRKKLNPILGIDHLMVSSLHDHEAPDTMGIWSAGLEKPYYRWDENYMQFVIDSVVEAAEEAVHNLQPAEAILAQQPVGPEGFVDDSRQPIVYDNVLRLARFVKPGTDETIGTMMVWGCHPETMGGDNPLLTSDFSHYWREGVENGVKDPNGAKGFGGEALYFQGQVGGLMTQLHTTVPDRNGTAKYREDSWEKTQALGENLAIETIKALRSDQAWRMKDARVAMAAKTVFVPIKPLFEVAAVTGLLHPGWFWGKVRSEVDAFRVGDIEILTLPGEIYPEICEGGVEAPAGQDYAVPPMEVPPLRGEMKGKLTMIMGLANDELGYVIPKSQWDVNPPFAYGRDHAQYGEQNSFGPDVAVTLHHEALSVLKQLHQVTGD
jgi:hypothetical protein